MTTESKWWRAVLNRDYQLENAFVYGVNSTGVYCRASCPSRRPSRQQVVFFPAPDDAERAGFRACLRCRPRHENARIAAVREICRYIEDHLDEPLTLAALAAHVGFSRFHLQRLFKRVVGASPLQFASARRLDAVKSRLRQGRDVTTALYDAGFSSSSRLYENASERLGMTPATYGRGGDGMKIGYEVVDSPLGRMLVAGTARGICAVSFGATRRELERWLRNEFPRARIERGNSRLDRRVRTVLDHLNGHNPRIDVPLDVRATAFQCAVWQALREIPIGATRSYSDVARRIGRPGAARAVARACASNPAAVLIPCHRVVRGDGNPGGYRWGTVRKKALLKREKILKQQSKIGATKVKTRGRRSSQVLAQPPGAPPV